jgi:hypothetical protein
MSTCGHASTTHVPTRAYITTRSHAHTSTAIHLNARPTWNTRRDCYNPAHCPGDMGGYPHGRSDKYHRARQYSGAHKHTCAHQHVCADLYSRASPDYDGRTHNDPGPYSRAPTDHDDGSKRDRRTNARCAPLIPIEDMIAQQTPKSVGFGVCFMEGCTRHDRSRRPLRAMVYLN